MSRPHGPHRSCRMGATERSDHDGSAERVGRRGSAREQPAGGLRARRPLHPRRRTCADVGRPGPRPHPAGAAPGRPRSRSANRRIRLRIPGIAARRVRRRGHSGRPHRHRRRHALHCAAGPQRRARGHSSDGQPTGHRDRHRPGQLRRRRRCLVRQGTGAGPGQRRDPPRRVRRHASQRRRARAHR